MNVRLITGPTGSGKTSLIPTLAGWVWKKYKKVTRLVTADGGGWGSKTQSLIDLGILEVWRPRSRCGPGGEGLVEETIARASQGWWPMERDAGTGETLPGAKLLPPVELSLVMVCKAGHVVKVARAQKELVPTACSQCKVTVTLQTAQVSQQSKIAEHFGRVGAYAFEGISSWSSWQLMSLSDRRGRRELHGEKSNIGSFKSGEIDFDGNNRADYGFAQGASEKWLLNATTIPALVTEPIWTGLETPVDETGSEAAFYGPQIAGSARTGQVPQWVGDWLGCQTVINSEGRREFRLYLSEYRDPKDDLPHRYKSRCEPGYLPEFLSDGNGKPFSGFNLGVYLDLLADAVETGKVRAAGEFPDAPGLGSGKIEGGEVALGSAQGAQGSAQAVATPALALPVSPTLKKPPMVALPKALPRKA